MAVGLQSSTLQLQEELADVQDSSAKTTVALKSQLATLGQALEAEKEHGSTLERSLRESLATSEDRVVELQAFTSQLREELAAVRDASAKKAGEQQSELTKLQQDLKNEKERAIELEVLGQDQKTESERKLANLERSFGELETELATARSIASENVLKLKSDISRLEQEFQTEKEQASNLQNVYDGHKTDAEGKAACLETTLAELHEQLAKANSSADEKVNSLQSQVLNLEQHLQTERDQASDLQTGHDSHRADSQSRVESLEAAITQLKESLARTSSEAVEKASSLEAQVSKLEHDLVNEQDRTAALQTSHANHKSDAEAKIASLETARAEHHDSLAKATFASNQHATSLQSMMSILEKDLQSQRDHTSHLKTSHESQLAEFQGKVARMESDAFGLRQNLAATRSNHKHHVESLEAHLKRTQDDMANLERNHHERYAKLLDAEQEAKRALSESIESHATTSAALKREREIVTSLEGDLSSHQDKISMLDGLLAEARGEAAVSSASVGKLHEIRNALQKDLDGALENNQQLLNRLSEANAAHVALQEQLDTTLKHRVTLENELASTRTLREQLEKDLASGRVEADLDKHSSGTAESKTQDLESHLAALESQLSETTTREQDAFERSEATVHRIRELEDNLVGARNSLQELEHAHQESNDRVNFLEQAKTELEEDFLVAQRKLAEALENNRVLGSELDNAKATIFGLQVESAELRGELADVQWKASRYEATTNTRLSRLQVEKNYIAAELKSTRSNVAQLETEKSQLLNDLHATISALESDRVGVTEELRKARIEVFRSTAAQDGLVDQLNIRHKQTLTKVVRFETERNRLANELDDARTVIATLQDQHLSIQQQSQAAVVHLREENKDLSHRLKSVQAVRNRRNTALNAVRVQLGTAKMAKRSVMAKLHTVEKDFAVLQRKNGKVEAELAKAEAQFLHSEGASQAWQSEVVRLRKEHADLSERVIRTDETCSKLREAVTALEIRAVDAKNKYNHLQEALQASEATIVKLRDEIKDLQHQHQGDLQTICHNDQVIAEQNSQISILEDRVSAAEIRAQTLKSDVQLKEAEAVQLQQANDEYALLISPLHAEIRELRASKAALDQIVKTVKDMEGQSRLSLDRSQIGQEGLSYIYRDQLLDEENSYFGGSNSVGGELRPMSDESRPMSGETRVGTSHSNRSSKALRTLGLETRPNIEVRHTAPAGGQQKLYELWEDEREKESPRKSLRRSLTKKKKEEELGGEKKEHGKLYNLAHFGTLERPHFLTRAESRAEAMKLRS